MLKHFQNCISLSSWSTQSPWFCSLAYVSSALLMETRASSLLCLWCGVQLAGYKVKCMLAEPKGKRTHPDSSWSDPASPLSQQVLSSVHV